MSQKVVGRQESFSWNGSPILRPWFQAHVDPLAGSPAVKLLIVKHLEESRHQEEEAQAPLSPSSTVHRGPWDLALGNSESLSSHDTLRFRQRGT